MWAVIVLLAKLKLRRHLAVFGDPVPQHREHSHGGGGVSDGSFTFGRISEGLSLALSVSGVVRASCGRSKRQCGTAGARPGSKNSLTFITFNPLDVGREYFAFVLGELFFLLIFKMFCPPDIGRDKPLGFSYGGKISIPMTNTNNDNITLIQIPRA